MTWKKSPRFRILTVNIPFAFIDIIKEMKKANIVVSQSEYIRQAVWEKLSRDLELMRVTLEADIVLPEYEQMYETTNQFIIEGKVWNKK